MATEKKKAPIPGRRRLIIASLLGCTMPAWSASIQAGTPRFAAAWNNDNGHWVGLLGQSRGGIRPGRSIEVPTRAHGLLLEPDGGLLAVARRPGDWLLRWQPGRDEAHWVWAEPDRAFNGHLIADADGKRLFSTETDLESGQGLIGVWDARSLRKLDEWQTHGIDAHMMMLDGGTLLVANGGIPTRPETGRIKRNLHAMDSSLVRLDRENGGLMGQWRLPDRRLSLRHLARNGSHIGIAMQAEHDAKADRDAAPVLAVFDGKTLTLPQRATVPGLAGYAGDIAAWDDGFAIAAPRAGAVLCWSAGRGWQEPVALPEACPIVSNARHSVWAGGRTKVSGIALAPGLSLDLPGNLRLDNHWVLA